MNKPLKISDEASVQMPMKTVASLIAMVAIGTWAYFGIIEKQNKISTTLELMEKDLTENTEFRIKWPRGEMGSLPSDSQQDLLLEFMASQLEAMQSEMEGMMSNSVNIKRAQTDIEKMLQDIEKLKDKVRQNGSN
jgi:succinate dehydrogenase/fumarate reductase flavoprotein subunit